MPEKTALIAVLISARPLCLPCLSVKAQLSVQEVESYLRRIESIIQLTRATDRCGGCGNSTEVFSMFRAV